VEQDDGRVLLALLPRGEAAVYRLGPDLRAVAPDVVRALGLEGESACERGVRSAGVAHLEVVAAEIVPGGRVLLLVVLRDGLGQHLAGLSELLVPLVGLLRGVLQV